MDAVFFLLVMVSLIPIDLTKLQNDTCKFKSLCCTGTGTAEDIFEVKGLLDNNTVIANCTWISTVQLLR